MAVLTSDLHARVLKQFGTLAGCVGCLGIVGFLAFWGLVFAALIKLVFFGGFN